MSQPCMTVSNTHGTYVSYDPLAVDAMAEHFYARINTTYGMDALRMFTASITGVDNWWNGETPFEMFIALSECGASPESLNDYIKRCARDDDFDAKVHAYKVDNCNMLCCDYRCMAHRSASIYTEAYEMNEQHNELTQAAASVRAYADVLNRRQELNYAKMDEIARKLSEIKGEHIPN